MRGAHADRLIIQRHRRLQEMLPTPTASSYGSNKGGAAGRVGPTRESLETMARKGRLPTPTSRDYKGGSTRAKRHKGADLPGSLGQSTRCLNPLFVEWMMGLPPGWTATTGSAPSATPSFPNAPKSSGTSSRS